MKSKPKKVQSELQILAAHQSRVYSSVYLEAQFIVIISMCYICLQL